MLAWRVLHDARLSAWPGWLSWALPHPPPGFDRDPLALLVAALASLIAIVYLGLSLFGFGVRVRAWLLSLAAFFVVVVPTLGFVALGAATARPYGQDGGVVQLPLAIDKILDGRSPYAADYSDSILGKQARVSSFWDAYPGGNPILRHHAYLPGTHLVMLPVHLLGRHVLGFVDTRIMTLLAWIAAALLAARFVGGAGERALCAAAVVLVNPLLYWQQIFGANDIVIVALLLWAALLAARDRPLLSAAVLGFACATKQLAWPFAPFLLVLLAGATSWRSLFSREVLARLLPAAAVCGAVFAVVVLPVAALDFRAFWSDIVGYNVGLPGADNYPLGGTPGFGVANFLIYFGHVASLKDYVPFSVFYLLLIPVGLLLASRSFEMRSPAAVLALGSTALLLSLYFSRVVHPNYLILAAVLLPVALLAGGRFAADVVIVPLLLLLTAVEVAESGMFQAVWSDAVASRLPVYARGLTALLMPRADPSLTTDPLGLLFSALAAGIAILCLVAGVLGARPAIRTALALAAVVAVVVLPTFTVMTIARASGVVRAQDAWLVTLAASYPTPDRAAPLQAWSPSFRRDPPATLPDTPVMMAPGQPALAWLVAPAGMLDARRLSLTALLVAAVLLLRIATPDQRPLLVGAALLTPVAAVGAWFGSGDLLLLAMVLAAVVSWRLARPFTGGLLLGMALTLFPRLAFAAPLLIAAGPLDRRHRALPGVLAGVLGMLLPSALVSGGFAALLRLSSPVLELVPGIGLAHLALYSGGAPGFFVALGLLLPPLVVVAAVLYVWRRTADGFWPTLPLATLFLLTGLWLTPGASPHDLLVSVAALVAATITPKDLDAPKTPVP